MVDVHQGQRPTLNVLERTTQGCRKVPKPSLGWCKITQGQSAFWGAQQRFNERYLKYGLYFNVAGSVARVQTITAAKYSIVEETKVDWGEILDRTTALLCFSSKSEVEAAFTAPMPHRLIAPGRA